VSTSKRISTMLASFQASQRCADRRPGASVGSPILGSVVEEAVFHGEQGHGGAG
jgi:hypothetical protein